MNLKIHKGQGVVWIILIIAIVALIAIWISKNPSSSQTTAPTIVETIDSGENLSGTPTPTKSLTEINMSLKELDSSALEIDKGINDTQLDINQQ